MNTLRHLIADERAEAMPEYALLLALIAIVTVISITALRNSIIGTFDTSSTAIESDLPSGTILSDIRIS